ncbi:hypothetical protein SAMN04515674_12334 [Pseudarcicella hirudinis]|uniref:Uncharacterized protein n=1 Tax=Pseudarcicella hirudinis TaxID=1079859 RepID=A0A1I5Z0V5_9BACT|nr:hypothetical protein [Pseudarcicella hirudinis]SFQ50071.1 hypothetical protein SAMN04515674_12334 [Pseudarcicella hirudinis]
MIIVDYILLVKHFKGGTSAEEESSLQDWLSKSEINRKRYEKLKISWNSENNPSKEVLKSHNKAWSNLFKKIVEDDKDE